MTSRNPALAEPVEKENWFATVEAWRPWATEPRKAERITGPSQSTGVAWTPETLADHLRGRGFRVKHRGRAWWSQCPCPEHDDRNPSCEIRAGDLAGVVVKCWSGPTCTQDALLAAIGAPPGWRTEPLALRLPESREDCLCPWHQDSINEEVGEMTTLEAAELLRWLHAEQRQHLREVVVQPEKSSSSTRLIRSRQSVMTMVVDEEALLVVPAGLGRVMNLVVEDLVGTVNGRLAQGEERAVPYASPGVGDRLGVDPRQVRKALERLRGHGVVVKVGELPRADYRWEEGTPLYALAVRPPCPLCASLIEGALDVREVDADTATATGDGQAAALPVCPNCGSVSKDLRSALALDEELESLMERRERLERELLRERSWIGLPF